MEINRKELIPYSKISSYEGVCVCPFFKNVFDSIIPSSITLERKPNRLVFECTVNFSEKYSNFLNIVHGGSITVLFDNMSSMFLYFYNSYNYHTIENSIIYISQTKINTDYKLIVSIEKPNHKTVFIECSLLDSNKNETCKSIIIKEKKFKSKL